MPYEQPYKPGISSRRSACDRCRFQKARCLRDDASQSRCDRCLRADAECLTSPIFRMRNYSSEDNKDTPDRGQKRRRQENGLHQQELNLSPSGGSVPTTFGWLTRPLPAIPNTAGDGYSEVHEMLFSETIDLAADFDHAQGFMDLTGELLTTATTPSTPQPAVIATHSYPTRSEDLHENTASLFTTCDGGQCLSSPKAQSGVTDCANIELEETHMQRLSKIDYTLITLLERLDKGPPDVTMDTLVSPIDESKSSTPAVDDILSNTREYIDVLQTLSGSVVPSPATSVTPRRGRSNSRTKDQRNSDSDSIVDSPTNNGISPMPSSPRSPHGDTGHKLDTTALLLMLTAYIHILRLYVIISAHIREFVREVSESDDPRLCPVPGLRFSNFPIQSGNLQTTILIQIVTSLFESMESLLGLPLEIRMNPRRGEPQGLLSDEGFMEMARLVMEREDHGRPELGGGGIKALRENIGKVKQLLRETIAP